MLPPSTMTRRVDPPVCLSRQFLTLMRSIKEVEANGVIIADCIKVKVSLFVWKRNIGNDSTSGYHIFLLFCLSIPVQIVVIQHAFLVVIWLFVTRWVVLFHRRWLCKQNTSQGYTKPYNIWALPIPSESKNSSD